MSDITQTAQQVDENARHKTKYKVLIIDLDHHNCGKIVECTRQTYETYMLPENKDKFKDVTNSPAENIALVIQQIEMKKTPQNFAADVDRLLHTPIAAKSATAVKTEKEDPETPPQTKPQQ